MRKNKFFGLIEVTGKGVILGDEGEEIAAHHLTRGHLHPGGQPPQIVVFNRPILGGVAVPHLRVGGAVGRRDVGKPVEPEAVQGNVPVDRPALQQNVGPENPSEVGLQREHRTALALGRDDSGIGLDVEMVGEVNHRLVGVGFMEKFVEVVERGRDGRHVHRDTGRVEL